MVMNTYKKRKRKKILVISLLAILIASFIFIGNNSLKTNINGTITTGVSNIQEPLTKTGNSIADSLRGIFRFKAIVEENKNLKDEISRLKKEANQREITINQINELKELSKALDYINEKEEFEIEDGWAKVIGIIDESNKVSFKVLRDQNTLGIVHGEGIGGLNGYMLDGRASIIEGDMLVTTNIGIYPEGIEIGIIKKISFDNDTQLKNISVEPVVDFNSVQKVAVII